MRYFKLKLIRFDNLYLYIFQTFLALVVLATCWSYGLAWIVSAGEAQISKVTGFVQYIPDSFLFWMRFYHLFGLLWIAQFVIACQHMIIAGAVAGWYFSRYPVFEILLMLRLVSNISSIHKILTNSFLVLGKKVVYMS